MVINHQEKVRVDLGAARDFVGRLRKCLRLGRRDFNICFVGDREIARLNAAYRGKARPTDVLSFPWQSLREGARKSSSEVSRLQTRRPRRTKGAAIEHGNRLPGFTNFLGDIVISVETARRNARGEGHSTAREIRWLILHGALHLLGYDHENDNGEMTALELLLRSRLRI